MVLILIIDTITIFNLKNERKEEPRNSETFSEDVTDNEPENDNDEKENKEEQNAEEQQDVEVKEIVREIIVRETPQEIEQSSGTVAEEPSKSWYSISNWTERAVNENEISEGVTACARDDNTGRLKENMTVENLWAVTLRELENIYFYDFQFKGPGTYGHCLYNINARRAIFVGYSLNDEEILNVVKELQNE